MSFRSETPFDNIESSHEYVTLLAEAVATTLREVDNDIADATAAGASRRVQALQLVAFKLNRLEANMASSRLILNDLRSLRRLLLEERTLIKSMHQGAG